MDAMTVGIRKRESRTRIYPVIILFKSSSPDVTILTDWVFARLKRSMYEVYKSEVVKDSDYN
jgi:hypothetical protein